MSSLAQEYRRCQLVRPPEPFSGIDAMVDGWMGRYRRRGRYVDSLRRAAEAIDQSEEDWKFLSDAALRRHLLEHRETFRRSHRVSDQSVQTALAGIREAARRTMNLRPFAVQIMGALALHRGCLAEMATGEGKTLTAAMAGVLAGWTGRPCHIVTVNDYLARRDADWLRPLYEFCGVSVGYVTSIMTPADRAHAYAKDVTYTTSKEVVADFLRDRLRMGELQQSTRRVLDHHLAPHRAADGLVMRGLYTAIIDEADSVLIDEAVTPLIISSPRDESVLQAAYAAVWEVANKLQPGTDYQADLRYKEIVLLPPGRHRIEQASQLLAERWPGGARPAELIEQALTAREFFRKGKQYVVHEGQVVIVDEFTGRMMPMRKWRHGLHQAIEAKEGLPISAIDQTLARLSFQRYFRLYPKLAGMTGTAAETAAELWQIYRLPVVRIPTNRPVIRIQYPDRFFAAFGAKLDAIVADVAARHAEGRPVLVGTRNVTMSETIAARLRERGFTLNVLNALNDQEEAQIITQAGQRGGITIATNMAGRGTDILLGAGVAELGGLHVIATERHESHRIDRQLFGRAARQGDPGSAVAYVGADDELVRRFTPGPLLRAFGSAVRTEVSAGRWLGRAIGFWVQRIAQIQAAKARKAVMKTDVWLDEAMSFSGSSRI